MGQKHKNEREKTDWGVLYFSGTGNTRYCVSLLSDSLGRKEIPCPIEKKEAVEVLRSHEALILAYPIQYSNLPDIVRVFIEQNRAGVENRYFSWRPWVYFPETEQVWRHVC